MAIWQFDMHFLPSESFKGFSGPLSKLAVDFDESRWWQDVKIATDVRAQISKILPPSQSWRPRLEVWGYDDGNRLDLLSDGEGVADIFVRIDVRNISKPFLIDLLELARRNNWWLLLAEEKRVIPASFTALLSAIHRSVSFRFVEDPELFLTELGERNARPSEYES